MKTKFKLSYFAIIATGVLLWSCQKNVETGILNTGNFSDTTGTLKAAATTAGFPIGLAIDYSSFMNNATYKSTVVREASMVTFGYQMKHGAIVQDNGTMNFTNTDALFNAATTAGLEVYGHTLGWHANQNANYLKNFAGIVLPAVVNLIANGGFENGSSTSFTNWSAYNGGTSFSSGSGTNEVHSGNRSLKVIVAASGAQYTVQMASDLFNTKVGTNYQISFYIKAAAAGGSIRLSTGATAQYQGDQTIGTTWTLITWTIAAKDLQTRILFDMGAKANTYYVDDVIVAEVIPAPSGAQVSGKLEIALNDFITQIVTRYKGKVKAWDVVNELFADDGRIRNNTNTDIKPADFLVWSNYMGKDFGVKAFQYAQAADPAALLFINDYGLESSSVKTDSLVAYVAYLKGKGAKVDGIGTQMHISLATSYDGIDNAFKKLAATGLKVRVSELDVRANPSDKANFITTFTPYVKSHQAAMYKYVLDSYKRNVPAAQRYGVTIWGVDDATSWILVNQNKLDAPLLFDAKFAKKPAYSAVLQSLQGK